MATKDKTGGSAAVPWTGIGKPYVLQNTIDISDAANADVYQVLPIKAKTLVQNVVTEVVTSNDAATTSTVDIGDGSNTTGYDAAVSMKAAAATLSKGIGGTDQFITDDGKLYSVADTIDLVFAVTGTNTAGKVKVSALCVDLN